MTTECVRAGGQPSPAPAPDSGGRLLWADVAKAATIFLVVLNHLTLRHYAELDFGTLGFAREFWLAVVKALDPIRMPLFFALSGFFAASALQRSWLAVWRRRVLRPYYLFALWLALHAVFFAFESTLPTTRIDSAAEFAAQLMGPSNSLWFLYALSIHFAVAFALRGLGPAWAITVGVAASLLFAGPAVGLGGPVTQNLPFFLFGAYCPQLLRGLAQAASAPRAWALLLAYALLTWPARASDVADLPSVMMLLSAVGVALAIIAIVLATAALPTLASSAARLGRRTLPIYVLHLPALALLHQLPVALISPDLGVGLLVYPVLATAAICLVAMLAHRWLTNTASLTWLFDLPSAATRGAGMPLLAAPPEPFASRRPRQRFAA